MESTENGAALISDGVRRSGLNRKKVITLFIVVFLVATAIGLYVYYKNKKVSADAVTKSATVTSDCDRQNLATPLSLTTVSGKIDLSRLSPGSVVNKIAFAYGGYINVCPDGTYSGTIPNTEFPDSHAHTTSGPAIARLDTNGQFGRGNYVATDSSGNLYVSDEINNNIQEFTPAGILVATLGVRVAEPGKSQLSHPEGVAVGSDGFIYIADTYNNRIVKTKMDGSGWVTYGAKGIGKGNFKFPRGIAVGSDGYIYVSDSENNRIVKTKMDGSGWTTYGVLGNGRGQFSHPDGIAVGSDGYIYVSDSYNIRIVKTKIDGTGWLSYGDSSIASADKGHFNTTGEITLGSDGFIYVADLGNKRVVKTKIDGSGWTTYSLPGALGGSFINGVSVDLSGNIYAASDGDGFVAKLDPAGNLVYWLGDDGSYEEPYDSTVYIWYTPKGSATQKLEFGKRTDIYAYRQNLYYFNK